MSSFSNIKVGWDEKIGPHITIKLNDRKYGICICHRREDRSFMIFGHFLPVCARCTGIILGFMIGMSLIYMGYLIPAFYAVIFIFPLIIDGFSQIYRCKESTNLLRLTTGSIFGIGLMQLGEYVL